MPDLVAGSIIWRIFLNEREITTSASLVAPIRQIVEGHFDTDLGCRLEVRSSIRHVALEVNSQST